MRARTIFVLLAALGCGAGSSEVRDISQEDLLANPPANATILDVRTQEEFASGHVPDAINIPHSELADRVSDLGDARDAPVVVYCERGGRAAKAASVLAAAGFGDILHLDGDMSAWRSKGRPVSGPVAR